MPLRLSLPLALSVLGGLVPAQDDALAVALRELVDEPRLAGGRVGVKVVDLADGQVLAEHDADKGFMTASNMKLISSAVALFTLGPEFRFETRLQTWAPVVDGVLQGDLHLIGSGDPTFGGRQEEGPLAVLDRMARVVREELGIRKVEGRIVGDDDVLPDEIYGSGWQWDYLSADYAAQISGLCFSENVQQIRMTGTEVGTPPKFRVVPEVGYLRILAPIQCAEAGAKIELSVERGLANNSVRVDGRFPVDAKEHVAKVSVENPTRYAAQAMKVALKVREVPVTGPAVDKDFGGAASTEGEPRVLAVHRSEPLKAILHTLNKVSQNLYAEQLLRVASRQVTGAGDIDSAEKHAKAVLTALGVDVAGMEIEDGSGLTRRNLVQPRQLVALLEAIWRSEHRDVFLETLPIAGVDGTLKTRYQESVAKGRVRAKTGYISRVVALSGIVPRTDPTAPPLVFSILLNNFTCSTDDAKAAVDRFVEALCANGV